MIWAYFTIYALVAAISLLSLTILARFDPFERLFFRVITGGTFGAVSSMFIQGWTPALSYLEACLNGTFNLGGYLVIVSINVLAGVWIYNLFTTRRSLIV